MTVKFDPDPRKAPNGTILVLGMSFANSVKTYRYVLLKQQDLWYGSGSGRVPQAAGWGAVERWLSIEDGRKVEYVNIVTGQMAIWPPHPDEGSSSPVDTSQA